MDLKFVRPAIDCLCSILSSDELWEFLLTQDKSIYLHKDNYMDPMRLIISLLGLISEVSVPLWLRKQVDNEGGVKYVTGVRSLLNSVRIIFIRSSLGCERDRDTLTEIMVRLIRPSVIQAVNSEDSAPDSVESTSLYFSLSVDLRKSVIEIWHYCPFSDISWALEETLNVIFSHTTLFVEPLYLLQVVRLRKAEFCEQDRSSYLSLMSKFMLLSVSKLLEIEHGNEEGLFDSLELSSCLNLLQQAVDSIQDYAHLIAEPDATADYCHRVMKEIGMSIMIQFFSISYDITGTSDTTPSTWKENYIRLCCVHAILYKLVQHHSVSKRDDKDICEETSSTSSDLSLKPNRDDTYYDMLRFYSELYISLFAAKGLPSGLFRTSDVHNLGNNTIYVINILLCIV